MNDMFAAGDDGFGDSSQHWASETSRTQEDASAKDNGSPATLMATMDTTDDHFITPNAFSAANNDTNVAGINTTTMETTEDTFAKLKVSEVPHKTSAETTLPTPPNDVALEAGALGGSSTNALGNQLSTGNNASASANTAVRSNSTQSLL